MSTPEDRARQTPDSIYPTIDQNRRRRPGALLPLLAIIASAGIAGGVIANSVKTVRRPSARMEARADTTGYLAGYDLTGNDPVTLLSFIQGLPKGQRPYELVKSPTTGKTEKVDLDSVDDLAVPTTRPHEEQLTLAGLVLRQFYVLTHRAPAEVTPALQISANPASRRIARAYANSDTAYTGDSEHAPDAPNLFKYAEFTYQSLYNPKKPGVEIVIPEQS